MQPIKCLAYVLCLGAVLVSISPAQTASTRAPILPRRIELQRALASFASWAKRYATKSGSVTGASSLEEGLRLAKQRRVAFLELIQSDPSMALTESLPANLRNLLPAGIVEQLEVPLNGTGDLLVLCAMPAQGAPASEAIQRFVRINGHTYTALVFGRRLGQTTKYGIPLHGVAVDGVLALDDKVLAALETEEASSPSEPIVDLSAVAGPLAGSGPPVLARMGGRIYRFASGEHLKHSEALLESAESGLRPSPLESASVLLERLRFPESELRTAARPKLDLAPGGLEAKVLVIRADFSDMPGDPRPLGGGDPYSASSVQALADTQVASFYRSSSYGNATLKFTVAPQLYRLPTSAVQYATAGNEFQLYDDALAAAAADYVVTNYDKVLVLFSWLGFIPGSQLQFAGLSVIGTSMLWVNGEFDFRVVAHELGHTYGLYHANFWHPGDDNPIGDYGSSTEYGDPFDIMAANWGNDARADFNPWFKYQINWIHDDQVQTVTTSGTYRVYRFDDASATGTLALRIAKDATSDYWIGYRRNFTENSGLQHGAYVVWGYHYPRQSNLLGLGPTVNNARDPGLVLDTVLADVEANVTIVPVAEGGTTPNEYLDVEIVVGPPPPAPVLSMNIVADRIVLSWPASAATFALETCTDPSEGGSWAAVQRAPSLLGGSLVVTNDLRTPVAFFRLRER